MKKKPTPEKFFFGGEKEKFTWLGEKIPFNFLG